MPLCSYLYSGVPDTQEDHAPRMAKFAASCQTKMGKVISSKLTDRLGPDTAKLALRVGMHSGPITGGILRGGESFVLGRIPVDQRYASIFAHFCPLFIF